MHEPAHMGCVDVCDAFAVKILHYDIFNLKRGQHFLLF